MLPISNKNFNKLASWRRRN